MAKRYNPYRVKTKEITKFRGITDEAEAYNSDDAFASGMSNVDSFKIRALSLRQGQVKSDEYPYGGVHSGGSFVSTRGLCTGRGIFAESKSDIFASRPSRYPWRSISIPLNVADLGGLSFTLRCRDLNDVEGAFIPEEKNNTIVGDGDDYLKCYSMTCSGLWDLVGDMEGYEQTAGNDAVLIDMFSGFDQCYTENTPEASDPPDDGTGVPGYPAPPPFPPIPGLPPVITLPGLPDAPALPEYPGFERPDWPPNDNVVDDPTDPDTETDPPEDPDEICSDGLVSFDPPIQNEVVVTLLEGYSTPSTMIISMSSVITSNDPWRNRCSIEFSEIETNIIDHFTLTSAYGGFGCRKGGTAAVHINIPTGLPAGTIIHGNIKSVAMNQSVTIQFRLYVAKVIHNINVSADMEVTKSLRDLLVPGSLPTIDAALETFRGMEYEVSMQEQNNSDTFELESKHLCFSGALNVQYEAQSEVGSNVTQEYMIPLIPGLDQSISAVFIWISDYNRGAGSFNGSGVTKLSVPSPYACGWSETLGDKSFSIPSNEPTKSSRKLNEVTEEVTQGFEHIIDFGALSTPPFPPGRSVDPIGGGSITSVARFTGLQMLVMGNAS